jgi:transposase, IS5 family
MKKPNFIGFGDFAVERRKVKSELFTQIDLIIDWKPIVKILDKYYSRGQSAVGNPSYPALMLFKMELLQTWYGLSDYELEDQVNDRISFSRFVGLSLDDKSPDHSVVSRFRTELTKKKAYDKLFKEFNRQLEHHKIIIKSGALIDASLTQSPRKPKGKAQHEIVEDRSEVERPEQEVKKEENAVKLIKKQQPGVDSEGRWVRKAGKLTYGYKKHHITDNEGIVLGVLTTAANVNEITNLEDVLDTCDLPQDIPFMGDKGYQSKKNNDILKQRKLKSRLMKKGVRGKKLTHWETKFNKAISKIRYKVERTFAGQVRWFGAGLARYIGLAKTHTQHLMEAMAYNLYRSPGIIASCREK